MWINGSDIRFILNAPDIARRAEMKYVFHALYTHVPDRVPGHATSYSSSESAHICIMFADCWLKVRSNMRVRVVDGVFGAMTMTLCVHLWVGFEKCYWEHYIREMHLIQT